MNTWTYSTDEECWPGHEFFATRDEALAAGRLENPEGTLWTGWARWLSEEFVADVILRDLDDTDERIADEEEFSSEDSLFTCPTPEQEKELHALVVGWLKKHKLVASHFNAEDVQEHAEEQATARGDAASEGGRDG